MNRFEQDRNKRIYEITAIVKILSLFFGTIPVFVHTNIERTDWMNFGKSIFLFIFLFGLIYQLWMFPIRKTRIDKQISVKDILDILLHIIIMTSIILYSGGAASLYKPLYLFIILTSTLQFGIRWGVATGGVASLSIIIIDLVSYSANGVNPYFQSDLVLIGVFFLTSWLLGYYMHTEEVFRNLFNNIADMDEMTGLYNHRKFLESIKTHIDRSICIEEPFSLILLDIDYFKHYNNMYGHEAGDQVLIEIGRIIEDIVGNKGTCYRYGGEEFAIILPGFDETAARSLAEEIRMTVERHPFEGQKKQPGGSITISAGVTCFPDRAKSLSELLNTVDQALYRAKLISKNKVEVYFSVLEQLKNELKGKHLDLISSIKTLISIINAKDRYTFGHTERVVRYCKFIGSAMGLSKSDMRILQYGAYLHDIGKIEIPKEILNKEDSLSQQEWDVLKQHPVIGAEILKPVSSLESIIPVILYHHERVDGTGYPEGLKGSQIPLLARILAVADSFDAMTSNRCYKTAMPFQEAVEELRRCSGTHFDEEITRIFIEAIENDPAGFQLLS